VNHFYIFVPENATISVHHKKSVFIALKNMGYINVINLISLESIYTLYGTHICYHGWVSGEKSRRKPGVELSSVQDGLLSLENIFSA
jgi:hypothetical protein